MLVVFKAAIVVTTKINIIHWRLLNKKEKVNDFISFLLFLRKQIVVHSFCDIAFVYV